ncbi:MAG: carboxypeptidase-like regulatory domain-containing protein [Candidatus Helarchaeota archaeon]
MKKKNVFSMFLIFTIFFSSFIGLAIPRVQQANLIEDSNSNSNLQLSGKAVAGEWWNESYWLRVRVDINSSSNTLLDYPFEKRINFTQLIENVGFPGSFVNESVRVVEYNTSTGEALTNGSTSIPCWIDDASNGEWVVFWTINGTTLPNTNRTYYIYFNTNDPSITPVEDNPFKFYRYPINNIGDANSKIHCLAHFAMDQYDGQKTFLFDQRYASHPAPVEDPSGAWEGKVGLATDINGRQAHAGRDQYPYKYIDFSINSYNQFRIAIKAPPGTQTCMFILSNGWYVIGKTPSGSQGGYRLASNYFTIIDDNQWHVYEYDLRYMLDYYSPNVYQIEFWNSGGTGAHTYYFDNLVIYRTDNSSRQATKTITSLPEYSLGNCEVKKADFTINVLDIDGDPLPNASVFLINESVIVNQGYTNSTGSIVFEDIQLAKYNITVNYTSTNPNLSLQQTITLNNTVNYDITSIHPELTITCDIWTMNFNVQNIDGNPLEHGWVCLYNESDLISNVSIDQSGNSIIRWLNNSATEYNISVYYNQSTFVNPVIKVNDTTIQNIASNHQNPIVIETNISRCYFNVTSQALAPLDGAILILMNNTENVANFTVEKQGNTGLVTLDWLVSNYTPYDNYSVLIEFYGQLRKLNHTSDLGSTPYLNDYYNFTLYSQKNVTIGAEVVSGSYETELIPLHSTEVTATWGDRLGLYALFNISSVPGGGYEGPAYADSITATVKKGTDVIFQSTSTNRINKNGTSYIEIDTNNLMSQTFYTIEVGATKKGYNDPDKVIYTLYLEDYNTNFTLNQQLPENTTWADPLNLNVSYNSTTLETYQLNFSLKNETGNDYFLVDTPPSYNWWILDDVYIFFDNVTNGTEKQYPEDRNMKLWFGGTSYDVKNGPSQGQGVVTLTDLNTFYENDTYAFEITSDPGLLHISNWDAIISVNYTRNVEVLNFTFPFNEPANDINLTIPYDSRFDEYRKIEYINMEFYNIRDSSNQLINATDALMNVTFPNVSDYLYSSIQQVLHDGQTNGTGYLKLYNLDIFPENYYYNLTINSTGVANYSVNVSIGLQSAHLANSIFESMQDTIYMSDNNFSINATRSHWNGEIRLEFENLNNTSLNKLVLPSEINLNVTYNGQSYVVNDNQINGSGTLSIPINTNYPYTTNLSIDSSIAFTYDLDYTFLMSQDKEDVINDASVQILVDNVADGSLVYAGNGMYNLSYDTSRISATTHNLKIEAIRQNYLSGELIFSQYSILERETLLNGSFSISKTISVYKTYAKNITFFYNDSVTGNPILGATTIFHWEAKFSPYESGSGQLVEIGNGEYILDFNTETRSIGEYNIFPRLSKDNYEQKLGFILLRIVPIPINITLISSNATTTQSYNASLKLNLTNQIEGWPLNISLSGVNYSIISGTIPSANIHYSNVSQGIFSLNITTNDLTPNTVYQVRIKFNLTDYGVDIDDLIVEYDYIFYLNKYIPATQLPRQTYNIVENQGVIIQVNVTDPVTNLAIINANVSLQINGRNFAMNYNPITGMYEISLSSSGAGLTVGFFAMSQQYTATILVEYNSYTLTTPLTIDVFVVHEEILGIPLPYFILIVIAVGAVVAIFAGYYGVKRARIPFEIKKIDETIKGINKNKKLEYPVLRSKAEIFEEMFGENWAIIGLTTPIKGKKKISEDDFIDVLSSIKKVRVTAYEAETLKSKLISLPENEAMKVLESMGIPPDTAARLIKLAKK